MLQAYSVLNKKDFKQDHHACNGLMHTETKKMTETRQMFLSRGAPKWSDIDVLFLFILWSGMEMVVYMFNNIVTIYSFVKKVMKDEVIFFLSMSKNIFTILVKQTCCQASSRMLLLPSTWTDKHIMWIFYL